MAKRQAEAESAQPVDAVASTSPTAVQAEPHPDDVRDADPEQMPSRGGSYVIEGGVRRLVERTEQL